MSPTRRVARYNSDLGEFELQCLDCRNASKASYWPLTLEYWDPRSLIRCRACHLSIGAERARKSRARSVELRRRNAEQTAAWRARNPGYNSQTSTLWKQQHPQQRKETDQRYRVARLRRLSDTDAAIVVQLMERGARASDLAAAYGVTVRTIYHALERVQAAA